METSTPELLLEEDVRELQQALATIDMFAGALHSGHSSSGLEWLVAKLGHLIVQIYQEQNHFRPHIHVTYKNDYKASYALDTIERIVGKMPRHYEKTIQDWAKPRQTKLLAVWSQLKAGRIPDYTVELQP